MGNTFTHSMYSERERRLVFLEAPGKQEVQVPNAEQAEQKKSLLETLDVKGTDLESLKDAVSKAQEYVQKKLSAFEADLQKTEHMDGSTTVGLNLKLRIPGAAKIVDMLKSFTSGKKEQAPAEEPKADTQESPAEQELPQQSEQPEESQAPTEDTTESSADTSSESTEKRESLEKQLDDALVLIQKQQEQIVRLTALLEQQQARLDASANAPANKAPDAAPNRAPLTPRSPDARNTDRSKQAPSLSEQRETALTPREALVRSAKDAMNSDSALDSDMGRLYQFFETQKNNMPNTYEAMEDNQPDMYYTMALASAKINKFAFDISKLDPKTISDGRKTIQNSPQGTFDFMKEVMMSSGSGMTRAPDVVSNDVRNKASGSVSDSTPSSPEPAPRAAAKEKPELKKEPKTAPAKEAPAAKAPDAPQPKKTDAPEPATSEPEAENKGLDTKAVQGLKVALGTLANTVTTQSDGNATIDLSSVSDNQFAKQGVGLVLDSLNIRHKNGKIAVTKENIAAITAAAAKIVDLVTKVSSGNLTDLPLDVSQKMLDAIDKQLPANMRGKLKLDNANIALDVGDALEEPLAKLALEASKLEVKEGKIIIKPQDIAKVVAALPALERFFPKRQEA